MKIVWCYLARGYLLLFYILLLTYMLTSSNPSFFYYLIWWSICRALTGSKNVPVEIGRCRSFTGHFNMVDRSLMTAQKVSCCITLRLFSVVISLVMVTHRKPNSPCQITEYYKLTPLFSLIIVNRPHKFVNFQPHP